MLKKSRIDFDEKYLFDWYNINIWLRWTLFRGFATWVRLGHTVTRRFTSGYQDWIRSGFFKHRILQVIHNNCKLLAIYCNPDHVHILIGSRPSVLLSDLVRKIKSSSSKFIHEKFDKNKHFVWQEGYGVFTYSRSQVDLVTKYILNQEEHHREKLFREEYINMLKKSRIDFDEKYLFDWYDINHWLCRMLFRGFATWVWLGHSLTRCFTSGYQDWIRSGFSNTGFYWWASSTALWEA